MTQISKVCLEYFCVCVVLVCMVKMIYQVKNIVHSYFIRQLNVVKTCNLMFYFIFFIRSKSFVKNVILYISKGALKNVFSVIASASRRYNWHENSEINLA